MGRRRASLRRHRTTLRALASEPRHGRKFDFCYRRMCGPLALDQLMTGIDPVLTKEKCVVDYIPATAYGLGCVRSPAFQNSDSA